MVAPDDEGCQKSSGGCVFAEAVLAESAGVRKASSGGPTWMYMRVDFPGVCKIASVETGTLDDYERGKSGLKE